MACPGCGRAIRPSARFCGACGSSLVPRCASCGAENEPGLRYCEACGKTLEAAAAAPSPEAVSRKVVSIVFADLVGSTALHERLDAEAVRQFMEGYYAAMRGAVEAHGGRVTQVMGDGVKAVFGAPRVAEDDAIRAVHAAVAMQEAFRAHLAAQSGRVGKTGLRVAVNTGEVVADDASEIIGDPVNVAARLQEQGRDGDVVLGGETQRIVAAQLTLEWLGSFALKGRSEAVEAYRVVSLEAPAAARTVAFVGRDEELRRLLAVYEAAVSAPATRLAVLLGSPGLGKSRLLDEVTRRLGDEATVLSARCDASGGATFAPLVAALRMLLGLEGAEDADLRAALERTIPGRPEERARITAGIEALLSGTPLSPEETFYDVRRLLAALATERPVVLAIDDLHWAEPLLLDLVEHLVQWGAGVRLLVLAAARPELREARSSLVIPGAVAADVVTLSGLDATSASRLAASVIGADALPAAVAGRVLTTSEGNPLFLRELVRMLVNDGVLRREGERWTLAVSVADLDIPPTIQALLAARIERLRPEERLVLERAAVVGRHFSRSSVAELLPPGTSDLDARLESLRRSELIEPDTGWFLGEPALRFHHVLIRDAAYRRVLKGTRAELHARLADWIVAKPGEHDETLGWHLEQAQQNLRELGTDDARARTLGERAARHLGAAGRRALARDDLPLASGLLGRALDVLDSDDPARADLALDWCEALLSAGNVAPAAAAVAELGRFAGGSERLSAWHTCLAGQLAVLTDPAALRATASAVARAAEALATAGDAAGEAKAHAVHATALGRLGEIGACEAALDRALAAARRVHDRRRQNAVLAGTPVAALWGPRPVMRASGSCLDVVRVLRITQGSPAVEAVALRCQALLEALRGRSEAARRMIAASRHMAEELGITQQLLEVDVFEGHIELLEGDAAAAERSLRRAYEGLREHGLGIDAARAAARLGRALLALGRAAEAEALSHESEALAGDDLEAAIAWRGVRAEALAARGEAAAAVELASKAVGIAAATDGVLHHADARLALAVALRAAGQRAESGAEVARASELWEQKGATRLAERARLRARTPALVERESAVQPAARSPFVRRLRANAASAIAERANAASAAGDLAAVTALFGASLHVVHHPTGTELAREAAVDFLVRLEFAEDREFRFRLEPLATLGTRLALCREEASGNRNADAAFDIGAYEVEAIALLEADAAGRLARVELFAGDRLSDALARLYERYAELLPEGSERARAFVTARLVGGTKGPPELDRWAEALAPNVEFVDRRLLGAESVRGAEALLQSIRPLVELSGEYALRVDDVLDARPDALLMRWTNAGTERAGGGDYERPYLLLESFGTDGRVAHIEMFDTDRAAEALARFDALTAERPLVARRRVRANAATAHAVRMNTAAAARDLAALGALLSERLEVVSHTNGFVLERDAILEWWCLFLGDADAAFRLEPVATLGGSLALVHHSWTGSASPSGYFDIGAFEDEQFDVYEVDAEGRAVQIEGFGSDRLADAIARLYARHAELLPEGPEKTRAAATARSVAVVLGPFDLERWAAVFAPDIEFVDPRTVGVGSLHGAEAVRRSMGAMLELSDGFATRIDAILALRSDALLVRLTTLGSDRTSGGAFERNFCVLFVFGADGLLTRMEQTDAERAAEALARFDALAAERPPIVRRKVRENAATAHAARLEAAISARDVAALEALFADDFEVTDHTNGASYDRRGALASFRALLSLRDSISRQDPLATLGDSLALLRVSRSGSGVAAGELDVGAFELEQISLLETDSRGRNLRSEVFAPERLGDAVTRLYERYAEQLAAGPERARAAAVARSVAILHGGHDRGPVSPLAPDVEARDHRTVGFGSLHGAEAVLEAVHALRQLSDEFCDRFDDVIELRPTALLVRATTSGTLRSGGGAFEQDLVQLFLFGGNGLVTRWEQFGSDQEAEALARFDALTAQAPRRRVRENAATAHFARLNAASRARDEAALAALLAPELRVVSHTNAAELCRQEVLDWWRQFFIDRGASHQIEAHATLGERLALARQVWLGSAGTSGAFEVGPFETEFWNVYEVDAAGRAFEVEAFAQLGPALARLYERHAERLAAGPERARAAAIARTMAVWASSTIGSGSWLDPETWANHVAPDVALVDHRRLGPSSVQGTLALQASARALDELTEDARFRVDDVLCAGDDSLLVRWTHTGTDRASGGSFERPYLLLQRFGGDGRVERIEFFDTDRADEAIARFEALAREAPRSAARRVPQNRATAYIARLNAACAARDLAAIAPLLAEGIQGESHTTGTVLDRSTVLEWYRLFVTDQGASFQLEPIATLGASLVLCRASWAGSASGDASFDIGPFARDSVAVTAVDDDGRSVRSDYFGHDRLGAALACLYRRHADLLPAGPEQDRAAATARTVARMQAEPSSLELFAPDVEFVDRRLPGVGSLRGVAALRQSFQALSELADGLSSRIEDVLGVQAEGALLTRWIQTGMDRVGGGGFEQQFLALNRFGADGRLASVEMFEPEHEAAALARFDALTVEAPQPAARRLVRKNAATASAARLVAAGEARDLDAVSAVLAEEYRTVANSFLEFDRPATLDWWRLFFADPGAVLRYAPLATLGDKLALCRLSWTGSASTDASFDIGPFERENMTVYEVDERGRCVRSEAFSDRLGAAVARLYERHAELLPAGPEQTRSAAIARAVAARSRPGDHATALRPVLAPELEFVDHRNLGFEAVRGRERVLRNLSIALDVADVQGVRTDDVLGLRPDALLLSHTIRGADRAGGGAYEQQMLDLFTFGATGLVTRWELFKPEDAAAALGRFDALAAETPRRPARRVAENRATANAARLNAAAAARDLAAIAALLSDSFRSAGDSGGPVGVELGKPESLAWWRMIFDDPDTTHWLDPLASLGDSLALCHQAWAGSASRDAALDVGPFASDALVVWEVDAEGRVVRSESFPPDRLGDAIAHLYARYAEGLPAGPEQERAAATARTVARMQDDPRSLELFAPDVEYLDRRLPGLGSIRGVAALRPALQALVDLSEAVTHRIEDVFAVRADALLTRWSHTGTDRATGGRYELLFLALNRFGDDGRIAFVEMFEPEREAEALARFDALAAEPAASARFENAAARSFERVVQLWNARDWERFVACFPPEMRCSDRRKRRLLELDRAAYLEDSRGLFALSTSRIRWELVATRGERLALLRALFEGAGGDLGPSELETLQVIELNERGERSHDVRFDPDDLDAAYAELDARYLAGEGAQHPEVVEALRRTGRAHATRDWEALAALLAPDCVFEVHRLAGILSYGTVAEYIASARALVELAPDVVLRHRHVLALGEASALSVSGLEGTRDGGAFEIVTVNVNAFDGEGRLRRAEAFELDQLDAARARFAELARAAPSDPLTAFAKPNAATAACDRVYAAYAARDWEAMRAVFAPGATWEDRRRRFLFTGDVTQFVASHQLGARLGTRYERQLLGTAGPRVALERLVARGGPSGDDRHDAGIGFGALGAPYEVESLAVYEVDPAGRIVRAIAFDADDGVAARHEALARWVAHDATAESVRLWFEATEGVSDTGRMRAALAPDVVVEDHRRASLGRLEGAEAYLRSLEALRELTGDRRAENALGDLPHARHGHVGVGRTSGQLRDGGPFESYIARVVCVERGRITRIELFELEHLERAKARFEELRPDPLRIPPNDATALTDRWQAAFEARDWETFRALYSPELVFEDRRRGIRTSGGLDMFEQNNRFIAEGRASVSRTLIATAGKRLALERMIFARADRFEVEVLALVEVDAEHRAVAVVLFDPDDRLAASRELFERWARSGAAGREVAWRRALLDRDLEALRSLLPPGFVYHDHRRAGAGRLDADAYIAWTRSLFEESPDAIVEPLYELAAEPHGTLSVSHAFGTNRSGGSFESPHLALSMGTGIEIFDLDDLERARARFEELRPDPLRIPPNEAARAHERRLAAFHAQDWDAMRALASPGLVFEDRGKRALVRGDLETWMAHSRFVSPGSAESELIATAGERVALLRVVWRGERGGGPIERENLLLVEVDAEGRDRALISFDPDDRAAAFEEAWARFGAGEGAGSPGLGTSLPRQFNRRDWEGWERSFTEDFAVRDHRRLGLSELPERNYLASLRAWVELAPDLRVEVLRVLRSGPHGVLFLSHAVGTHEGGPFEQEPALALLIYRGHLIAHCEYFDAGDAERALARFEELCAGREEPN